MFNSESELDARIAINKQKKIDNLKGTQLFKVALRLLRLTYLVPLVFFQELYYPNPQLFFLAIFSFAYIACLFEMFYQRFNNLVTLLIEEKVIK